MEFLLYFFFFFLLFFIWFSEETEFVMGFQRTKQSERLNKINGQQSEMAYKTDCFQKNIKGPCDEHTAFRDLPYKVNVVLKQLDITGFDDWKSLAGNLGKAK